MTAVRVHRTVIGPPGAPAVVLSNSLGASLAMWDPQVALLARRFRVVRYDMRGHGRSPVPPRPYSIADLAADALAMLDDLDIDRAHLCGLSLGGAVSLWLAANVPERVNRLVVMSGSARFPNPQRYLERAATVRAEGTAAIAPEAVGRWLTPAFAADNPDLVERLVTMVGGNSAEGYAACCEVVATTDLSGILASIAAPTLVVAAAQDPALPVEHGEALAARIRDARLAIVEGAAHLVNVERPDAVTFLVIEHLTGERGSGKPDAAGSGGDESGAADPAPGGMA